MSDIYDYGRSQDLCQEIDKLEKALSAAEKELKEARELLFYTHPCRGKYGDDGEMQCNSCKIDFKRMSLDEMKSRLMFCAYGLPEPTAASLAQFVLWPTDPVTILRRHDAYELLLKCEAELSALREKVEKTERIYPCADCGVMRTKDEGGTVFTVCDDCWDKLHKEQILKGE